MKKILYYKNSNCKKRNSERLKLKIAIAVVFLLQFTVFNLKAQVTIPAIAGNQTYDISSLGFSNADILKIDNGTDSTAAVVVDGKIDFYVPVAATYTLTKKSTVAASTKEYIYPTTDTSQGSEGSYGGVLAFGQYKGVNDPTGTAYKPLTGLTHFIGIGAVSTGDLSSSWKQANTYAGYDWWGTVASNRGVCHILIEDRNETTGKLLASIYFDPSITHAGHESLRGPHDYNFIFNPADDIITTALVAHSTYKSNPVLQVSALDSVKVVRDADNSMVLANINFKRAYITGAKIYTFDIATTSNGKFKSGDVLEFKYLLGSSDLTVYHGTAATSTSSTHYRLVELENTAQSHIEKDTVDINGYVKMNIYGGGFFSLTKIASVPTNLSNAVSTTGISAYGKNLEVSTEIGSEVSVYNLTGVRVLLDITTADKTTYPLNNTGIYVVKVFNKKGLITQKCIIR